jgi:transposase-like protein
VQMSDAVQIRKQWEASGSPPCGHPTVHKEYFLGAATGDYICSTCGESFSRQEWREMREGPTNS